MRTELTDVQVKWIYQGLLSRLKVWADWGASEVAGAVSALTQHAHETWGDDAPPETDYMVERVGQMLLNAHTRSLPLAA